MFGLSHPYVACRVKCELLNCWMDDGSGNNAKTSIIEVVFSNIYIYSSRLLNLLDEINKPLVNVAIVFLQFLQE